MLETNFSYIGLNILLQLISLISFDYFNVATRKIKIILMARFIFVLDSTVVTNKILLANACS